MALAQPALRLDSHTHPLTETCPTCDQPIPNDKAREIRARAAAAEERLAAKAEARAAQKFAVDKAEIEAAAKALVEQAERDKVEALNKANDDAAAKIEAATAAGQKLAEAGFSARLQAAEKAKADAEKAKADAEAAANQKVIAVEQAAKASQEEAQRQIDAANTKTRQGEAEREATIKARVAEVRDAMEKDKAEALAKSDSDHDNKTRKLLEQLQALQRKLEEKRADELGEGAHIQLLDALKEEFPEDLIRRIAPGASGADILHTVMRNGVACGSILYESKNSMAWRDDYVTKLVKDQTAAEADHAILSTFKFPKDADQVEIRDNVIIVKPARAVAIAKILRRHLLHVHTLRLSKSERQGKMAELYDFMTSERYALLIGRLDTESEALLTLQETDKKYHDNHWKKEGLLVRSMQKVKGEIDTAVDLILGSNPETGLTE
jgi:hypothetical protein